MPAKTQKQLLEANMKELLEKLAELDRIDETTDPTPAEVKRIDCLLYTSPSPRDRQKSRMPSSA